MNLLVLQAIVVGDNLETDIQGGVNAGLACTVWVNRNGLALPTGAPTPTFTVAHVTEVGRVLEQLHSLPQQHNSFEGYGFALPDLQHSPVEGE